MATTININLIPPAVRQKRETEKNLVVLGLVALVAVVIIGLLYSVTMVSVRNEETKLENLKAENAILEAQIAQFKSFEEKKSQLSALEGLYNQAAASKVSWYRMLLQLALVAPDTISLVNFNADTQTFQIDGEARSTIDVATWLVRLEDLPFFEQVWLDNLSVSGETVKFTVKGNVKAGGAQ